MLEPIWVGIRTNTSRIIIKMVDRTTAQVDSFALFYNAVSINKHSVL